MEAWRRVWREAMVPLLSDAALRVLEIALESNSEDLLQGATTHPPPLECVQDWPCEGACPIGLMGWKGESLETVGEVEEFFARMCFEIDKRLGEPAGCRWFLNWWDETPRDVARKELLAEVKAATKEREQRVAA